MKMVNLIVDEESWHYWVIPIGTVLSFIGLIFACICSCRRHDNKNEFLGLAGLVKIVHPDNEGFNQLSISRISQVVSQDTTDCGKRIITANRSLPDIPMDKSLSAVSRVEAIPQDVIYEASGTIGDTLELYATVQDDERKLMDETLNMSQQNFREVAMYSYTRHETSLSNDGTKNLIDEHPYAQLQNVQKTESTTPCKTEASQFVDNPMPTSSDVQPSGNPVAPPRTRRSSSHSSLLCTESFPDIQAANAISGEVQANQDLPYMTPSLIMPPQHTSQIQNNNLQQNFSGDSQDSKGYTSISVREPLANIRAQTKQRQPPRQLSDSHYATVSDDSDEMYAAIDEQEKVYTSGSETYAQIQPMTNATNRTTINEPPNSNQPVFRPEDSHIPAPQPPSVDSLRHVAHAHSRQASSSSATSSIINPESPKLEKRQANSPLPLPPERSMDLYAQLDKKSKSEDRLRSNIPPGKTVEDMYAKVVKKKRDLEDTQGNLAVSSDVFNPRRKSSPIEASRASWSSHESVEIQKWEVQNSTQSIFTEDNSKSSARAIKSVDSDIKNSDSKIDYDYEAVDSNRKTGTLSHTSFNSNSDPNYETLRLTETNERLHSNTISKNEKSALIHFLPSKRRQASNASSNDPGYERVRLPKRVDLDQDIDSEPNYESMPHEPSYASVCRPGDSDADPNYESVNHNDPNYESVEYMSVALKEDPPYEQVNTLGSDTQAISADAGVDPNYEKIDPEFKSGGSNNSEMDDEQYVQV